jgi:hypothetical protein
VRLTGIKNKIFNSQRTLQEIRSLRRYIFLGVVFSHYKPQSDFELEECFFFILAHPGNQLFENRSSKVSSI